MKAGFIARVSGSPETNATLMCLTERTIDDQ